MPSCRSCKHLIQKSFFVECGLKVKNDRADKNRVNGMCQRYEMLDMNEEIQQELWEAKQVWKLQEPFICPENPVIVDKIKCRKCNACGKWDK